MVAFDRGYLENFDLINLELILTIRQVVLALRQILVNTDRSLVISSELVEATLVNILLEFDVEGRVEDDREVLIVADFRAVDVAQLYN